MADERRDDDMPEDPFSEDIPSFDDFESEHADEIRAAIREYASAKHDFAALYHQKTFRELATAVHALDEPEARAALLRAVVTALQRHMERDQFISWVES